MNGVTSMSEFEKLGLLGVKVFEEMPECEFEWLVCGDGRWTWGHIYMVLLRSVCAGVNAVRPCARLLTVT